MDLSFQYISKFVYLLMNCTHTNITNNEKSPMKSRFKKFDNIPYHGLKMQIALEIVNYIRKIMIINYK